MNKKNEKSKQIEYSCEQSGCNFDYCNSCSICCISIIEFSDYQCPFCARFYAQTLPLIET